MVAEIHQISFLKLGKTTTIILTIDQIKFPILGRFFSNNVGCQSNHLARVTGKQIDMKKAKYLFIFHKLERFVLEKW